MLHVRRRLVAMLAAMVLIVGVFGGVAGAASDRGEVFRSLRTIFETVELYHKDGADLRKFFEGAVRGGLEALGDPYTNYFAPQEFATFLDSLEGTVTGVGIYLEFVDNYIVVSAPIKGSPAFEAGLQTGDRILEANGVSLIGGPVEKAQSLIRGEPGTQIVLKIERLSENRTFEVKLTREVIHIPQVEFKMLDQTTGYIAITSFGSTADKEFYAAVNNLKEQGALALVLDLRQNPGGYVGPAVSIADAWVPNGSPVMYEVGKRSEQVLVSKGRLINMPTAVLVDGGSASASEILAGAIQDYNAGELVGTKTFGKGTVQQIIFMSDKSGMKVTIAEYLTARRHHVHGIGLTPDYVVEPAKPNPALLKPMVLSRVLTQGVVGLDVLDLQNRLAYLGYEPDLDGVMGTKTMKALYYFAWDYGASPSGAVDNKFVEALNRQVSLSLREPSADAQLQKAIEVLKRRN